MGYVIFLIIMVCIGIMVLISYLLNKMSNDFTLDEFNLDGSSESNKHPIKEHCVYCGLTTHELGECPLFIATSTN